MARDCPVAFPDKRTPGSGGFSQEIMNQSWAQNNRAFTGTSIQRLQDTRLPGGESNRVSGFGKRLLKIEEDLE